jgi:hypothetical protein
MSGGPPSTAPTAELPVRAVTLSNGGLVQIERAGELAPDVAIAFRAPAEDVDDLLKSLVLRDPEGEVEGVRLPAQDVEAEALLRQLDLCANAASGLQALAVQSRQLDGASS